MIFKASLTYRQRGNNSSLLHMIAGVRGTYIQMG